MSAETAAEPLFRRDMTIAEVILAYFEDRNFDDDAAMAAAPPPRKADEDVVEVNDDLKIIEDPDATVIISRAKLTKLRLDSSRHVQEPWVRRPDRDPGGRR